MKYNIVINQLALANTKLDIIDSAILDFIYIYGNSTNKAINKSRIFDEDGTSWTWLDLQTVINNLPLLRINQKSAITRRLQKIVSEGYIETKLGHGKKLYFRFLPKVDLVFMQSNSSIATKQFQNCPKAINNTISDSSTPLTNVRVGGGVKKRPSCPLLNGSPLKSKYTKGHEECTEYILGIEEARGRKFINLAKQYQILHRTLKAGYDFTELDKAIRAAEKKYGEWNFDLTTLAAFLEKGINART